ncbi:hypothetical protein ACLB2K_022875 [Fragaria x ananassa]
MNIRECRAKCLNNCTCMAYTSSDISKGGSGCAIWFGDLLDIRKFPDAGQDLYIRMSASEIEKQEENQSREGAQKEDLELPLFNITTIASATDYFSDDMKLGEGDFGPVYRHYELQGTLADEKEFAVKRLSSSSGQGFNEFMNEIVMIAKLQHRNLVKILGCCVQEEEKMLLYEYMPNRSLDNFIFDFGLARILTGGNQTEGDTKRVVGTYGYMAPEYAADGIFSVKSDVFSFSILVLEIISGRRNKGFYHPDHNNNLIGNACLDIVEQRKAFRID